MRLLLASGSPRRRELLTRVGIDFEVVVPKVRELGPGEAAWAELCRRNATLKARAVEAPRGAVVIGADTLVRVGERVLGKPRTLAEAHEMLASLSGRTHDVCTAVCLRLGDGRERNFQEHTSVKFRELGAGEIDAYFALVNPLDKAGAYGIQEHGEMLVESMDGDFDNVVGLPVTRLMRELEACGFGKL